MKTNRNSKNYLNLKIYLWNGYQFPVIPKIYKAREILKALHKAGFVIVSQKGSHIKLKGIRGGRIHTVIVPNHKTVAPGTFESILKQAGIGHLEFENFL